MPIPYTKPAPPNDDKRWKIVATRMRRLGDRPEALIEALHAAQEAFGFLDDDALEYVGDTLGVPHSRVFGVATFYSFFTLKPQGDHTCVVCTGTACYIKGINDMLAEIEENYEIKPVVDSVRPLSQGRDAFQRMADGQQFGKLVLSCS